MRVLVAASLVSLSLAASFVSIARAVLPVNTMQLTTDSLAQGGPRISGPSVVWWSETGTGGSSSREIFYRNTSAAMNVPLTSDSVLDMDPRVYGNYVAWWNQSGAMAATREVVFRDVTAAANVPLTTNAVQDEAPVVGAGPNIVWWTQPGANGTFKDLVRSDGVANTPLTSNSVFDGQQQVQGSNVVWVNNSTPLQQVLRYDGAMTTPVASSTLSMEDPQFSGGNVVWEGFKNTNANGSGREIYRHDGSPGGLNISNNEAPDFDPQISGNHVVWWGGVFQNFQIHHHDIGTGMTAPVSTGELNQFPKISGTFAVWQGKATLAEDFEIYFWNGTTVQPLTNNNYDDTLPQIYGQKVVWMGADGGDNDIFLAQVGLSGDVNLDGVVNIFDINLVSSHWSESGPLADGNCDLTVNIFDINLISANWTTSGGSGGGGGGGGGLGSGATPVPEPAALWLALVGATGVMVLKRRVPLLVLKQC